MEEVWDSIHVKLGVERILKCFSSDFYMSASLIWESNY